MKASFARSLLLASALALSLSAQTESTPPSPPETAPSTSAAPAETNAARQQRMRPANFNPAEMQTRMMDSVREQMGVKDDAEWNLISERITAVMELRRDALTSSIGAIFIGMNRGGNGGGGNGGGNRIGNGGG